MNDISDLDAELPDMADMADEVDGPASDRPPPCIEEIMARAYPAPANPATSDAFFPKLLPFEIAMQAAPLEDIQVAYGYSDEAFRALLVDPAFTTALVDARKTLQKDGASFKLKAQMQADTLLATSWELIHNKAIPPAVRADLLKKTIQWAGYEPKEVKEPTGPAAPTFTINMHLSDRSQPTGITIEGTATAADQD